MKSVNKVMLVLSVLLITACEKENNPVFEGTGELTGYWIHPVLSSDTLWTYERSASLTDDDYGFAFKPGEIFVERKNAGSCGTPPVIYADFEGNWSLEDSLISITVGFWGGLADYQWKIISIDNNHLTIHRWKEDYHME